MKGIANSKDGAGVEMARMKVTIIFMITILNLTGTHLHTPPGDIFFWFILGCISRIYRQWREESQSGKSAPEGAQDAAPEAYAPIFPLPGGPAGIPAAHPGAPRA
jgi:hypothetical protein